MWALTKSLRTVGGECLPIAPITSHLRFFVDSEQQVPGLNATVASPHQEEKIGLKWLCAFTSQLGRG